MLSNINNKKGQALIEFVIILPVLLLLLFAFIDFGKIIYIKSELNNLLPEVRAMHKEKMSYNEILKLVKESNKSNVLSIENEEYTTIKLSRNIELTTPGLGLIIGNPYEVNASLVINNEK